jgi:ribonuclease HI
MSTAANIHIDGAARGNPGPAAYAYVIDWPGHKRIMDKGCLGEKTNNVAEYTALLRALQRAAEEGAQHLIINSDSELLVKQMNGEYRVKNKDLQTLHEQASRLRSNFASVKINHVRREQNSEADRLCNEALDGQAGRGGQARTSPKGSHNLGREQAARAEILECLHGAAAAWAKAPPNRQALEMLRDQLWSILEEHGLVRG